MIDLFAIRPGDRVPYYLEPRPKAWVGEEDDLGRAVYLLGPSRQGITTVLVCGEKLFICAPLPGDPGITVETLTSPVREEAMRAGLTPHHRVSLLYWDDIINGDIMKVIP